MGSNAILIRNRENGNKQNILFTGDMGKPSQSLCGGYLDQVENYPGDMINTLVIESTNFLGEPISFKEKENNLLNEINRVWMNKGTPLLAVLSFHRLQEIFEILHNNQGGRIPKDCGFIVDAPLGMKLLENFKTLRPDQLSNDYGDEKNYYKTNEESLARFDLNNMLVIDDHETSNLMSRLMATYRGKRIIIAGGGMLEHGRVLNYVHGDFCKNPNNEIITTCHQVEGTRGASLEHNKNIPVGNKEGARIKKIEGFTSHISGKKETFDYIERYNLSKLGTIIIVHGKDPARVAMANEFRNQGYDAKIIIPKLNQRIEI